MLMLTRETSPRTTRGEAFIHLCDRYKSVRGASIQDRNLTGSDPEKDGEFADTDPFLLLKSGDFNRFSSFSPLS